LVSFTFKAKVRHRRWVRGGPADGHERQFSPADPGRYRRRRGGLATGLIHQPGHLRQRQRRRARLSTIKLKQRQSSPNKRFQRQRPAAVLRPGAVLARARGKRDGGGANFRSPCKPIRRARQILVTWGGFWRFSFVGFVGAGQHPRYKGLPDFSGCADWIYLARRAGLSSAPGPAGNGPTNWIR